DECARAEATGSGRFALVRLRLGAVAHGTGLSPPELLATILRPGDVLAEDGPDEYEARLLDVDAPTAQPLPNQVRLRLRRAGITPRVGLAVYPVHGRSPEVLMSRACDALAGGGAAPAYLAADPAIVQLDRLVDRLAAGTINILLLGETGVGKEVFA